MKSEGKCVMRYAPRVTPSRVTELVLQVMPQFENNTLFYLGKAEVIQTQLIFHVNVCVTFLYTIQGDYILAYTQNGLVHVSWDLGSGRGDIANPVYVVANETEDNGWFRIEVMR